MCARSIFFAAAVAAMSIGSVWAEGPVRDSNGAARAAVVYCLDRARDQVTRVLAGECRGEVIDEEQAKAIDARHDQKIIRALGQSEPPSPAGLRRASLGTAFYVDGAGRLITNNHIVDGCKALTILARTGEQAAARAVAVDTPLDLALLQADARPEAFAFFPTQIGTGSDAFVAMVGYPDQGLPPREPLVTAGTLLKSASGAVTTDRLVISANVRHGNSGGPLFDHQGQIIGIVYGKLDAARYYAATGREADDTGLAVPLPLVLDFLRRNGAQYQTRGGGELLNAQQILEHARPFVVRVDCWK